MVDIASLEESGLVLSKEVFSFTFEMEAMSKERMGVIGRCGYVREVDSRTEWVLGRDVMDSVCETDNRGADDGTDDGNANGSADECANNECANGNANNDATNYVSHANPYNTSSYNGSNETANCSTSHI